MSSINYRRPTVLGYPKVVYCMNISKLSCREFTKVNPDSSHMCIAYTKVLVGNIPTGTIHHQRRKGQVQLALHGYYKKGHVGNILVHRVSIPLSIPSQCTIGKKGQVGNIPTCTVHHASIPLSIPSQCTIGKKGQVGNIPTCTVHHASIPLSIPSQCTIGKKGQVGNIPTCTVHRASIPLSIPSQCTIGKKGHVGNIPTCTVHHASPTVHPIPMYHGKENIIVI